MSSTMKQTVQMHLLNFGLLWFLVFMVCFYSFFEHQIGLLYYRYISSSGHGFLHTTLRGLVGKLQWSL
jgi:hypothetical protein